MLHLWPNGNSKYLVYITQTGEVKHQRVPDETKAHKLAQFASDKGFDVYFTISAFDGWRKAANATPAALWADIDSGPGKPYSDPRDALKSLINSTKAVPPSAIVLSGNGLHAYWRLEQPMSRDEWLPLARRFRDWLLNAGLQFDTQCTVDAARILRVPGTKNWKDPENPKKVELVKDLGHVYSTAYLDNIFPAGKMGPVGGQDRQDQWGVAPSYPDADAEKAASRCHQLAVIRDTGGHVSEPLWRAGLSVLNRCRNAHYYVHEWSKGDPRYDYYETEEKAQNTAGPYTCAAFQDIWPEGCQDCSQSVTSPIQCGPVVEPPQPKADEEDWKLGQVGRFVTKENGVWYQPEATEDDSHPDPEKVSEIPIWVREVRSKHRRDDQPDQGTLMVEWVSLSGETKRSLLYFATIPDNRAFQEWLAQHFISPGVWSTKRLAMYISQYTRNLMRKQKIKEYHTTLGWTSKGFVLGRYIIDKNGPKEALVQSNNPIARINPGGDSAEWTKAANLLADPQFDNHAFAILAGFGSALLGLTSCTSAVISLAGKSGAGKTLAANFALSIYGDPDLLGLSSNATANARGVQLECNQNVPFLLDEVTNLDPIKLTEFIYEAANGRGKASLTQKRETRETGTWQLVPFTTSNFPILAWDQTTISDAVRKRVLELEFETPFPKENAKYIYQAIQRHAGAVGIEYLKELNRIREHIPKLFRQNEEIIQQHHSINDADRFVIWALAAARLGGAIAKKLGLINFDVERIIQKIIRTVTNTTNMTYTTEELAIEVIKDQLHKHSDRICHWNLHTRHMGQLVDNPIARITERYIILRWKDIKQLCIDNRISPQPISDFLAQYSHPQEQYYSDRQRISPTVPPAKVMIVPLEVFGLKPPDETSDNVVKANFTEQ